MKNSIKNSNTKVLHLDDSDGKYKIAAEISGFQQPTTFSFPTQSVNRYDVVYGEKPATAKPPRITNTERLQAERNSQLTPIAWFLTSDVVMGGCVAAGIVTCVTVPGKQWVWFFIIALVGIILSMFDWQRGDRERQARNVADFEARQNNCGFGYND